MTIGIWYCYNNTVNYLNVNIINYKLYYLNNNGYGQNEISYSVI